MNYKSLQKHSSITKQWEWFSNDYLQVMPTLWSVLYSDAAPDPILVLLLYSQHVCLFTGNYFGAGLV
jgi:hypothetical protein